MPTQTKPAHVTQFLHLSAPDENCALVWGIQSGRVYNIAIFHWRKLHVPANASVEAREEDAKERLAEGPYITNEPRHLQCDRSRGCRGCRMQLHSKIRSLIFSHGLHVAGVGLVVSTNHHNEPRRFSRAGGASYHTLLPPPYMTVTSDTRDPISRNDEKIRLMRKIETFHPIALAIPVLQFALSIHCSVKLEAIQY